MLLGGGLAALVMVALLVRLLAPGALTALSVPLSGAGNALAGMLVSLEDAQAVRAERDRLREEVETLRNERAAQEALLRDAGAADEGTGVLAGVIARPPMTPYELLVVAAGTRDGVSEGDVALVRGVPVGRVERVTAGSAHIRLFSAPGQATEGWVGEARLALTLTGAGAGAFAAEASREAPIEEGATVYLPGPGPRPVGHVRSVERTPASPSALVHIAPLINVFSITAVRIVPGL